MCLLARLKQLLSGHHHRYFLQRKNTTTSIIIPSICSSVFHSFIKHSVFKLHLIFLSKDTILFFLLSLKMILSSKTLYTLTFLFFITFNKILSWIRINRGYKHKDENILKMRKQNFLISKFRFYIQYHRCIPYVTKIEIY